MTREEFFEGYQPKELRCEFCGCDIPHVQRTCACQRRHAANADKYENRTCKNGHTCLIHKDRRRGYCPECEKIPVQLPNPEPMVMIPLEQYKQMLPVATQARYFYHRTVPCDGQNYAETIGFQTHAEMLIHLMAGEDDPAKLEELRAIWNATQPDRMESQEEKMERIGKMREQMGQFRTATTEAARQEAMARGSEAVDLMRQRREEMARMEREEFKPRDGETLGEFAARMDKENPGRLDFQYAHLTKAYAEAHKLCPSCGGDNLEVTCMGMGGNKDTNRARCICGWVGIVHDLIPAPAIREASE